jgi:hypothetical protein
MTLIKYIPNYDRFKKKKKKKKKKAQYIASYCHAKDVFLIKA